MQIKIIAVGSSRWERFIHNWGVSFLIEEDILFDTFGKPTVFLRNIKKQNIDLSKIKHIVISHDHWDHISGLWYVIDKFKNMNVYICSGFEEKIKERIRASGVNLIEVNRLSKIKDMMYTTGEILVKYKNRFVFEQSLVVNTEKGLVVLTGCAHPGIMAILKKIKKNFPEKRIFSVLGGFHLLDKKRVEIESIIEEFKKMGIRKVGPIHCTGSTATELFRQEYKDNFVEIKVGEIIEV